MAHEEFDPDATPIEGTRPVRASGGYPGTTLRVQRSTIRQIAGARRRNAPERRGFARPLALILAGVLVMLAALAVADLAAPSIFDGLRNISGTPRAPAKQVAPSQRAHTHNAPKETGPGPVLTALSPESATPGATIELIGSGFFSANHEIIARVAGNPAPTRCPTEKTCYVVLPAAPKGATETSVQIITETGSSNSLSIHYG
ncbi:MAG: IPT/TIG domain-containing protein [Acidimicrobiales bacterium]